MSFGSQRSQTPLNLIWGGGGDVKNKTQYFDIGYLEEAVPADISRQSLAP